MDAGWQRWRSRDSEPGVERGKKRRGKRRGREMKGRRMQGRGMDGREIDRKEGGAGGRGRTQRERMR